MERAREKKKNKRKFCCNGAKRKRKNFFFLMEKKIKRKNRKVARSNRKADWRIEEKYKTCGKRRGHLLNLEALHSANQPFVPSLFSFQRLTDRGNDKPLFFPFIIFLFFWSYWKIEYC